MKKYYLFCFLLFIIGCTNSKYKQIDSNSIVVPDSLNTYIEISNYLTKNLDSDEEKARAIYIWIANNIRYNLSLLDSSRVYNSEKQIIEEVLKNRQGVCAHYATLFSAMSNVAGLKSYLISGYTRNSDTIGHDWNGVKVDSSYYLIDVTWAAGYVQNGKYIHDFNNKYFLDSPEKFIEDHMPFDPIWQFLDNPINNKDFLSHDYSKISTNGNFSFSDSILYYEKIDEISQLENTNRRIIKCGVINPVVEAELEQNRLLIANSKCKKAIDTLNYAIDKFNLYINYRHNLFQNPKINDDGIKDLIQKTENSLYAAYGQLYGLSSSNADLNNCISENQTKISSLISDIEKEKRFINRYLTIDKSQRIYLLAGLLN